MRQIGEVFHITDKKKEKIWNDNNKTNRNLNKREAQRGKKVNPGKIKFLK
jgi:hypothetical protein